MNPEVAIVRRACQRDSAAFGQLYQTHFDRIYHYVYYRVHSVEEAEDITGQVFLKAWEAIERYQVRGVPFIIWLYRLAHNLVIDHYRGQKLEVPLDDIETDPAIEVDFSLTVDRNLEAKELREAIAKLRPVHQHILALRFAAGLSHAEAKAILGKSEVATRVLQHRALAALSQVLALHDDQPLVRMAG